MNRNVEEWTILGHIFARVVHSRTLSSVLEQRTLELVSTKTSTLTKSTVDFLFDFIFWNQAKIFQSHFSGWRCKDRASEARPGEFQLFVQDL